MKTVYIAVLILFGMSCCQGQGLEEANSRDDADIYASGSLVGASNAQTIYSFDVKFAYREYRTHIGSFQGPWYFRARPLLEYVTNEGTSTSPDYVNLGGEVGFFRQMERPKTGVRWLRPTSLEFVFNPRAEFDRDISTRNFVTSSFLRLAFPNSPEHASLLNVNPSLQVGVESGVNYSNALQAQGTGTIVRLYGGISAIFWHCGKDPKTHQRDQCDVSGRNLELRYQYRGPLESEVFTQRSDDPAIRFLSTKPRHYFEAGLRIPVFSYFALRPQYKWGSLPPAFSFMDHQYSLNLEVSAKRKK